MGQLTKGELRKKLNEDKKPYQLAQEAAEKFRKEKLPVYNFDSYHEHGKDKIEPTGFISRFMVSRSYKSKRS